MRRMTRTVVATMAVGILAACQTEPATVERTSEVTATVTAIDLPERLVTLRGPEGNLFTVQASEEVRDLPQLEVGDRVVVRYYEAIAAELAKPGQEASASATAMRAPPGAKPGGELAQEVTAMVKIVAVDPRPTRSRSPTPRVSRRRSPCRTPRCRTSSRRSKSATRSRSPTPRRSRSASSRPARDRRRQSDRQDHRRRDRNHGRDTADSPLVDARRWSRPRADDRRDGADRRAVEGSSRRPSPDAMRIDQAIGRQRRKGRLAALFGLLALLLAAGCATPSGSTSRPAERASRADRQRALERRAQRLHPKRASDRRYCRHCGGRSRSRPGDAARCRQNRDCRAERDVRLRRARLQARLRRRRPAILSGFGGVRLRLPVPG